MGELVWLKILLLRFVGNYIWKVLDGVALTLKLKLKLQVKGQH